MEQMESSLTGTIEELKNMLELQKIQADEEINIKSQELVMRNKEIEMMHNAFLKKCSAFESRFGEFESIVESKDKEIFEERLKREELEAEVRRLKEEQEDWNFKQEVEGQFRVGAREQINDIDETEADHVYEKLSSELNNLRSEIYNLKSERSNGEIRYYSKGTRIDSSKKINNDTGIREQLKESTVESNFSEIERLNDLEKKLNQKHNFGIELIQDSEDDILSIDASERPRTQIGFNPLFYLQSENQSPNQESIHRNKTTLQSKENVFYNIVSSINSFGGGSKKIENMKNKVVPSLHLK